MADVDHDKLVDEFCKVTGTDPPRARMYLEANGWDSDLAMNSYFEEAEEEPESLHPQPAYPPPESPKPAVPSARSSNIATFASLVNKSEKDDEEEGQAFYAGGSERSGQQVLGPGKRKANDVVQEMFKAVREFGGEVVDKSSERREQQQPRAFHGMGHVLGNTDEASNQIPGSASAEGGPRTVEVRLRMWQSGFTVDDGPLRDYHSPENRAFLDSVTKGEIPPELLRQGGNAEIHLNLEDHSDEVYVPQKPTVQAFSGTGFRLGNITPVMRGNSIEANEKSEKDAQNSLELNESKPVTIIQIRLADGSRLVMKANHSHTVADVRRYIVSARPEYASCVFVLSTAFPPKELAEDDSTLEEQNLLNSVIVQKLK